MNRLSRKLRNLGAALLLVSGLTVANAGEITISADQKGNAISPKFYGIFLEDINLACDGGLYAELIRNRNFEDSAKADFWKVSSRGSAFADLSLVQDVPTKGFNKQSALLKVDLPEGKQGSGWIVNEGYYGISVTKGDSYDLSLYAKGTVDHLKIVLADEDGNPILTKTIPVEKNWKWQSLTISPSQTCHKAKLCVGLVDTSGEINVDMVSLYPKKTWKFRKNGLRPELAKMLKDLNPAFVRFPGGCWVEGDRMKDSYRWKETIGNLSERRTQHNIWGYEATHGMGFHEYLQMCEDIGAQALFVINCGMSHKEVVPMDKMDEYVQDALDAIEYANGDKNTKWGAIRAANGHEKPFNLTMLQVGNENGGPAYNERYALFYDAIKAKYPEIEIVACLWNGRPTSRGIDILDEHYYSTPEFFANRYNQYDTYDRKGPQIYVGEYAVTQKNGNGALRGALGEAIFMMGMENNGDIVTMTSYAPLMVNVNHRSWTPDLINYDNHRVYGTPSYHLQKLFSNNHGDFAVPAQVTAETKVIDRLAPGGIGLGTWITQAEFKDIKVTVDGKAVYENNGNLDNWKLRKGNWKVQDGAISQSADGENNIAFIPADYKNYTLTLKAKKIAGSEGFLILFNAKDDQNYGWVNLGGWGNNTHGVEVVTNGGKNKIGNGVPGKIETGKWYDIKLEVSPEKMAYYLDDQKIEEVSLQTEVKTCYASASATADTLYVKVVNLSDKSEKSTINLNTERKLSDGEVITLSHPSEWAENSLEEPDRVVPVTESFDVSNKIEWTFEPNSITVFKIGLK